MARRTLIIMRERCPTLVKVVCWAEKVLTSPAMRMEKTASAIRISIRVNPLFFPYFKIMRCLPPALLPAVCSGRILNGDAADRGHPRPAAQFALFPVTQINRPVYADFHTPGVKNKRIAAGHIVQIDALGKSARSDN